MKIAPFLFVASLAAVLATTPAPAQPDWWEPSYGGKTLSSWLDEYGRGPAGYKSNPAADDAIRHIGVNAAPQLLQLLHSTNFNVAANTPPSWDHWKAYLGFQALGPLGKVAIPDLAKLARSDPTGTSYYPNIQGMKEIAMVASLADNSSSYVALGDGVAFHGGHVLRNPQPFLVDGEIAAWSLAAIGADAVPSLMELFKDSNPRFKQRAAEALGWMGAAAEPAVPGLLANLTNSSFEVRQRVADALGEIGKKPELAVPALIGIINDPGYGVGGIAAEALGKFGESATNAIPALLEGIKSGPYLVKPAAEIALSKISRAVARKEVIPVLIAEFQAPAGSHNGALATLSQIHDEDDLVIPAIIGAVDDAEQMVQHNAINMLGRFGPAAIAAEPKLSALATNQNANRNADAPSPFDIRGDAAGALDKIDPGWRSRNGLNQSVR